MFLLAGGISYDIDACTCITVYHPTGPPAQSFPISLFLGSVLAAIAIASAVLPAMLPRQAKAGGWLLSIVGIVGVAAGDQYWLGAAVCFVSGAYALKAARLYAKRSAPGIIQQQA